MSFRFCIRRPRSSGRAAPRVLAAQTRASPGYPRVDRAGGQDGRPRLSTSEMRRISSCEASQRPPNRCHVRAVLAESGRGGTMSEDRGERDCATEAGALRSVDVVIELGR